MSSCRRSVLRGMTSQALHENQRNSCQVVKLLKGLRKFPAAVDNEMPRDIVRFAEASSTSLDRIGELAANIGARVSHPFSLY